MKHIVLNTVDSNHNKLSIWIKIVRYNFTIPYTNVNMSPLVNFFSAFPIPFLLKRV